ncbi:MAG: agmatine deiminase family protein [Actinobacteria bacterium]|nr:agmatine deiminase family protein [Actinomycetota bacterium]
MSISRRSFLAAGAAIAAAACTRVESGQEPLMWRAPGEWEPHAATWQAFPGSRAIWGRDLTGVQEDVARIANTIAAFEPVLMCINPVDVPRARGLLSGEITMVEIPVDDFWMRDTGPVFRVAGTATSAVGLNFNGWGEKQRHPHDASVAEDIAAHLRVPFERAGFVAEGGGIETDGSGNLMATRSSILNRNRNPGRSQDEVTAEMLGVYGATNLVWLPGVRGQDITDDHVDSTSRFVAPGAVLVQEPLAERQDAFSSTARRQLQVLRSATTADGDPFSVTTLPGPRRVRSNNPDFLDSYVNFAIVNGAVIMPEFGEARADTAAAEQIQALFKDREVVQINVDNIQDGGGGIHCATLSQPAI